MTNDEPWSSLVIAPGETVQHGRDPEHLATTLCGRVVVTEHSLYRGPFWGDGENDCRTCAELLPNNHY